MKYLTTALTLIASPALADITPAQLLESWHKAFDRVQIDLTVGGQVFDGDVLVLSDVQLTKRDPLSLSPPLMDWVRLSPLPGGAVSIALSSTENAAYSSYDGLEITASGPPEKITYSLTADRLSYSEHSNIAPFITDTAVVIADLSLLYTPWEGANGSFRSNGQFSAKSVAVEWAESQNLTGDPNDGVVFQRGKVSLTELSMPFDMAAPAGYFTDLNRPLQGLPEDLTMDMKLLAKHAALHINGGDMDPGFTLDISTSDNKIALNAGDTNLRYLFDFSQILAASNTRALHDERLTLSIDRFLLDLSMPFRKSDSATLFALATRLESLEIGPAAWDIFDPNAEMARVPASLDLQVTGEATLLIDLFDQEAMSTLSGPPFHVHTISLDRLDIQLENALLMGAGRVVVDNDIMNETTGMPEATGSLDFALTGALAFLGRLEKLPNLDPMMALGAKGALGMFAAPTTEPDSFTSRIEFTNGGHISVNGQQVK